MMNESLVRKNIFTSFLFVVLSILLPQPSWATEMPAYERQQPITSSIATAIDVATDQSGHLYVADPVNNSVMVFDENGHSVAALPGLSFPLCVDVDAAGNMYIGNKGTADVEVYNSNFTFLHKLGSGNGEFIRPNDLAIAAAGQIYVVDWGADIVKAYNADGTFSFSFGGSGNGDGEFHRPVSIAIDEIAQELIVLDHQLVLDVNWNIWIDGARIQVFDMNGVFKRGFTKMRVINLMPEDLYHPQRVTVDEQGRLYVTDTRRNVVQVYDSSDGVYLGTVYDLQDPLRIPVGITLGGNNLLYIAARGTGRVEVYQLSQAPQSVLTTSTDESISSGQVDGTLSSPTHVGETLTTVQTAPGAEERLPEDRLQPSDSESSKIRFPWILFRHLLKPR